MRFVELKQSLSKNILPAYLLTGKDDYLKESAQAMIEKACASNMPDFNISRFNDENFDQNKIVDCANSFPMGDKYRVVVVKGLGDKVPLQLLQDYLKKPSPTTCMILYDTGSQNLKNLAKLCEHVDCNYLDFPMLEKIVSKKFAENNIKIDAFALKNLVEFCNFDLMRINLEIQKLSAAVESSGVVDSELVNKLVHKNVEYTVFQLSNAVAEKDRKKAIELLDLMLDSRESPQVLLMLLVSSFKRMFYAVTTKASDDELASMLEVKPYAIKISRNLARSFNQIKLKNILDLAGELDFDIKNGKITDENAIYFFVSSILLM